MVGKIKITLKKSKIELEAELYNTPTGNAVWELLPIKSQVSTCFSIQAAQGVKFFSCKAFEALYTYSFQ